MARGAAEQGWGGGGGRLNKVDEVANLMYRVYKKKGNRTSACYYT